VRDWSFLAHLAFVIRHLSCADAHGFNNIAHVAGGIPKRFERLGLADAVGGFYFEFTRPRLFGGEGDGPFAEGIFAKVLAESGFAPVPSAVFGKQNLLDAVSAVERNSANGDGLA